MRDNNIFHEVGARRRKKPTKSQDTDHETKMNQHRNHKKYIILSVMEVNAVNGIRRRGEGMTRILWKQLLRDHKI